MIKKLKMSIIKLIILHLIYIDFIIKINIQIIMINSTLYNTLFIVSIIQNLILKIRYKNKDENLNLSNSYILLPKKIVFEK